MADKDEQLGPERATTPVGQYYLLDKIAQGGMAEIYKGLAYDLHGIKKTVVIKRILPQISSDPEFVNMLINEAKIAVMLSHGNIAHIYDLGKVGNDYFMVMEFVDGKSLSQIHKRSLKKGHMVPIDYVSYFISEVASGLNYMHRRSDEQGRNLGIIHRDISPQNVIISYSGTVKIIDFGIAKAAIQMNITESGVLKGKFAYMSPEQAKGEPMDHRSDIFSLGVILHELLTGKRLFKGKNKKETLKNVRRAAVPPPSSLRADLPKAMDKIVLKALNADPRKRYMWASELRDDLIRFIYTTHPDFQPSEITEYVRDLFKEDISEAQEQEEEAKTPFLIIDHTQSAIMPEKLEETGFSKVPPQLKEFMLDEETPHAEVNLVDENTEDESSIAEKKHSNLFKTIKKRWKGLTALGLSLLLALNALYVIGVSQGYFKMPKFLQHFAPSTRLSIYVKPPDSTVTFGGEILFGESPYKLKGIKHNESYRLIVEKDGYLPFAQIVTVNRGQKKKLKIELEPEPAHFATLNIKSTPAGAVIFLNEKRTKLKTPAKLTSLQPTTYYTVGLFLDNYIFWRRDFHLKPDEEKSIDIKMEINYGRVEVISSPPGATIKIDGKVMGATPFVGEKMRPGEVLDIAISKTGFSSWSEKVQVKAGKTLTLRPRLSRTKEYLVPHFLRDLQKPAPIRKPAKMRPLDILPPAPVN
jgi:serine/threonine protein kinase